MTEKRKVELYAKQMGYEGATFRLKWKEYNVYEPIYSDELSYIGLPLMILEKDGKMRMTDVDEAFAIQDIVGDGYEKIETMGEELNQEEEELDGTEKDNS